MVDIYIILVIVGAVIFLTALINFLFYHEIRAFFSPKDYSMIIFKEIDNNIFTKLVRKNNRGKFIYKDSAYNMYPNVYRFNRLSCYMFLEGNENQVDITTGEHRGNAELNEQMLKQDLSKLWEEEQSPIEKLMKYLIPLIIIVGIIVIIIMLISAGKAPAVQPASVVS